jgi:hypothetical protein
LPRTTTLIAKHPVRKNEGVGGEISLLPFAFYLLPFTLHLSPCTLYL